MPITLPEDRMSEAEVALRLAFHLLNLPSSGAATVAIDGAQVYVHGKEIFPLVTFLAEMGWRQTKQHGRNKWQGCYTNGTKSLEIRAQSGIGDVVVAVGSKRVRAECKKGPLARKKGSKELPLLHEAIGQLMTIDVVNDDDVLIVAVPLTDQFRRLAQRWRVTPLMTRTKIGIVLVGRDDGTVEGLPPLT